MRKKLFFLVIFIFSSGCGKTNPESACNTNNETNQYEVYSAVINKIYGNSGLPIVIFEKTLKNENDYKLSFNDKWLNLIKKDFPDFDVSIAESFNLNNEQSYPIERKFSISNSYKFASEKDFNEIHSVIYPKYFDKFQEKFPEAASNKGFRMLRFSKVGFNKNISQAVLYVELWADRKAFFILKRVNCQWIVVRDETISVH